MVVLHPSPSLAIVVHLTLLFFFLLHRFIASSPLSLTFFHTLTLCVPSPTHSCSHPLHFYSSQTFMSASSSLPSFTVTHPVIIIINYHYTISSPRPSTIPLVHNHAYTHSPCSHLPKSKPEMFSTLCICESGFFHYYYYYTAFWQLPYSTALSIPQLNYRRSLIVMRWHCSAACSV